ncbi:hypothetical protein ACHAWF_009181 [Thalassiosira exigua]
MRLDEVGGVCGGRDRDHVDVALVDEIMIMWTLPKATSWPRPRSALLAVASWWIVLLALESRPSADAWTVPPWPATRAAFASRAATARATTEGPPSPSSLAAPAGWLSAASPPSPLESASGLTRGRRTALMALSSAPQNQNLEGTAQRKDDDEEAPVLRILYDAPPPLPADEDVNEADSNDGEDERWATRVTSGTLPTEDGSPHHLYYEVHHRFRRRRQFEGATSGDGESGGDFKGGGQGLTALFLHGGPGAGCFPNHVRFFSPELYPTVVLLDQRGCGRSTPLGETEHNTLELLVEDVERLRRHVLAGEGEAEARPWDVVLGGSWGCTLALAYAHAYPGRVRAMVLRGVCLFRKQEIDWLFGDPPSMGDSMGPRTSNLRSLLGVDGDTQSTRSFRRGGRSMGEREKLNNTPPKDELSTMRTNTAAEAFPKAWKEFCKGSESAKATSTAQTMSDNQRIILHRYYHLLLGSDPIRRLQAVKFWMRWEMGIYSSGFGDKTRQEGEKKLNQENQNNTVLVWNPTVGTWIYEDARVQTNSSILSIHAVPGEVDEDVAQSFRRFFSLSTSPVSPESTDTTPVEPMPIKPISTSFDGFIPRPSISNNSSSTNSTFDPTTFVPAQSMLTCYYSTNDDYCIGPYRSFLSLAPPNQLPRPSWYSSELPPPLSSALSSWYPGLSSTKTLLPHFLPPTISIQGGNDAICPPDTALDLHGVWNQMELRIVLEGGHSMYGRVIAGEIIKATDRFGHALADPKVNQ